MVSMSSAWAPAADQPGVAPYARFSARTLIEDAVVGRVSGRDGVVVAIRVEDAAAATALLGAAIVLSRASITALGASAVYPAAVSGVVRLTDLAAILALAESTPGLVLVDVSQVLPADALLAKAGSGGVAGPMAVPPRAVVAIIDDGIALGHGRFRDDAGGSRFAAAWVMDGQATSQHAHGYGRIYGKADLDQLISAATGPGGFNDRRFMTLSGLVDHSRDVEETVARAVAHGTAVLDLMAGRGPGDGAAADVASTAPIIAVQFPSAQARDTSGAGLRPFVRDAIQFVLTEAARLTDAKGTPPPVVINLSYGLFAGPHDGTHAIERDIEALLAPHDHVHLVLPSGNSALAQSHGRVEAPGAGAVVSFPWRMLPDDRTPSFVELWPRGHDGAEIELSLQGPDGVASGWVGAANPREVLTVGGQVLAEITHTHYAAARQGHGFVIAAAPTFDLENGGRVVDHGVWQIAVRSAGPGPLNADLWVQRDVGPYGSSRRGRQSYLDDDAYRRFDEITDLLDRDHGGSLVQREGTISAMATGDIAPDGSGDARLHVIGGWQGGADRRPAMYTSRSLDGARVPKMAVQSECSRFHRGQLAAGTGSASRGPLGGTSVAAPQYARALVNALAVGGAVVPDHGVEAYEIKPGIVAHDGIDRVGAGKLEPVYVPDPARRL